jgi:hypothetical protein
MVVTTFQEIVSNSTWSFRVRDFSHPSLLDSRQSVVSTVSVRELVGNWLVIVLHIFQIFACTEMAIGDLKTEQDIKSLDAFLADHSYVEG